MNTAPPAEKAFWHNLTLALFALALVLPGLVMLTQTPRAISAQENRVLAPPPVYSGQPVKTFLKDIETYVNDHFGLRETFIFWNQFVEVMILGQSSHPQVVIGEDRWLFFMTDALTRDFQGLRRFRPEELAAWASGLEQRRDWFRSYGIDYLYTIAPEKQSIYPEYVPDQYVRFGPTSYDQLMAYMAENSDFEVIDLRPALLNRKPDGLVFYKYDTHWNHVGGYYAYRSVLEHLDGLLPDLTPVALEDIPLSTLPFEEDLGRILGLAGYFHDPELVVPAPMCELAADLPTPLLAPLDVPGSVYRCGGSPRRLLFFGDSFGSRLLLALGTHFGETLVVDQPLNQVDDAALYQLITTFAPDIVIEENSERTLSASLPRQIDEALAPPGSESE